MPNRNYRVLFVDDDPVILHIVKGILSPSITVDTVETKEEASELIKLNHYPLVIVDFYLTKDNGVSVVNELKKQNQFKNAYYLILTSQGSSDDELYSYKNDVDEFIKKPIENVIFKAKVEKYLKRATDIHQLDFDDEFFRIDFSSHKVFLKIENTITEIELTKKEFMLLSKLVTSPNKVFNREELLEVFWETDTEVTQRTLDMHISNIRKKLLGHGNLLATVRGQGYQYLR